MYEITIAKIESVSKVVREYEKIADTGNERDGKAVYGFVDVLKEVEVTTTVLKQAVDELDIAAVIKAVNNIK